MTINTLKLMKLKECTICLTSTAKYRCPQCNIETCSAQCSTEHKKRSLCSGLPNPTSFLNKKDLLTIQSLDRDYNFLSAIESSLDSFVKNRMSFSSNHAALKLKKIIEKCGIRYLIIPRGMSRACQNKTFWSKKRKKIFWTIEWIYIKNETKISNIEHNRVPSDINIVDAYKNFIHKRKINELLDIDYQTIQFMIKKVNSPANNSIYETLNKNTTLLESLKGMTILEFPTIHIIVNENKNKYASISKEITQIKNEIKIKTEIKTKIKQNGIVDYDSEE
ncbi:unnamed protein product [Pneumocystis jirovecii]|uniref:HIT-type domain-containing protein n=1 Tax=Pneumocystis jirovecii TaxID=42068 RepID=L0PGS9_PNEJI|nr:unnamed protein product [Pneumocystis jirovecii]CCJ31427.1 unnamed protein product [Pneumocystis jirovecii]